MTTWRLVAADRRCVAHCCEITSLPSVITRQQIAWPLCVQGLRQSAVDALTAEQQLTAEQLQAFVDNDDAQCKICLMDYEVGDTLRRLPCQHV